MKVFLGYSLPPVGGHETSLMDSIPSKPALPCFGNQLPNLHLLLLDASSLLRGRDTQCTSSPDSRPCPEKPFLRSQMKNSRLPVDTHLSLPSCTPDFQALSVQKRRPDTMPARSSLQDLCLIAPQHLKADFG